MLRAIKHSSLSISRQMGLGRLVGQSGWRRERLLILCYHGVSLADEHEWNPNLYVSTPVFARRLELLWRCGCTVLPLGEAVSRLYDGTLPPRAVVLTFDDGYHDFLARAYPLLRAYRFPATVYLTTMRCEHNFPIVNLLIPYLLWKCRNGILDGRDLPGLGEAAYPLSTPAQRDEVATRVMAAFRRLGAEEKDAWAARIASRLGFDYERLRASRLLTILSPDDVTRLSQAGVDIELHTHTHRTPEDIGLFTREVLVNRERIEAMTGRHPTHFCYPSGVYRASYLPVLERAGIVSATTCEHDLATRDAHRLLLPRLVDRDGLPDAEFEGWLTGVASWLPRRTGRPSPERLQIGV